MIRMMVAISVFGLLGLISALAANLLLGADHFDSILVMAAVMLLSSKFVRR